MPESDGTKTSETAPSLSDEVKKLLEETQTDDSPGEGKPIITKTDEEEIHDYSLCEEDEDNPEMFFD